MTGLQQRPCSASCLGTSQGGDPKGDYYLIAPASVEDCAQTNSALARRYANPVELSGERWADGSVFYTRYNHILTPNKISCDLGNRDFDGQVVVTASSRHPGGVNLQTADGAVRFVKETIDQQIWSALGTIAGREVVGNDQF